ncbi:UDP-glucose 4-epimerase-like [Amphiura filiformis]|uniref:UDP-glucose 4-epimerase-like n=1 Tax=Amphiura filiformis TaxID=82378 RepID=UPI003B21A179
MNGTADKEYILVTGGAGYIGSHTVLEMLTGGFDVIVTDNYANAIKGDSGIPESIRRIQSITNRDVIFQEVDVQDIGAIRQLFSQYKIRAVIHFAALKAVGESIQIPLSYYRVNTVGTLNLLEVMREYKVYNIVFSSSATVYGTPQYLPIDEKHATGVGITNPYGRTKYFNEEIMKDLCKAEPQWNIIILRYFNPVGAHKSGQIGEDPQGPPNNLMPFVAQVAVGRRKELKVYGNDYDTPDGTGVRDYIHVVDLALGHLAALKKLSENAGLKIYNLGTGKGNSVLDMVNALEKASGKKVPYSIEPRREGDVATVYGDASLAEKELNWKAHRGLEEMCEDLWRWQAMNPKGF